MVDCVDSIIILRPMAAYHNNIESISERRICASSKTYACMDTHDLLHEYVCINMSLVMLWLVLYTYAIGIWYSAVYIDYPYHNNRSRDTDSFDF